MTFLTLPQKVNMPEPTTSNGCLWPEVWNWTWKCLEVSTKQSSDAMLAWRPHFLSDFVPLGLLPDPIFQCWAYRVSCISHALHVVGNVCASHTKLHLCSTYYGSPRSFSPLVK